MEHVELHFAEELVVWAWVVPLTFELAVVVVVADSELESDSSLQPELESMLE